MYDANAICVLMSAMHTHTHTHTHTLTLTHIILTLSHTHTGPREWMEPALN